MELNVYVEVNKKAFEIPLDEQTPLRYLIPLLIQKLGLDQQHEGRPVKYTLARVILPDETLEQAGVTNNTLLRLQMVQPPEPVGPPKQITSDKLPDYGVSG